MPAAHLDLVVQLRAPSIVRQAPLLPAKLESRLLYKSPIWLNKQTKKTRICTQMTWTNNNENYIDFQYFISFLDLGEFDYGDELQTLEAARV